MKKKVWDHALGIKFPRGKKILLKMKLTLCIILFSLLGAIASESYSQTTKLSLNLKESAVRDVLGAIENQSEFFFLYSEKIIDVNRRVNIEVRESTIEKILDKVFAATNVNYAVKGRQIVLTTPEATNFFRDSSTQQRKSISGKVIDDSGLPLPGVTVLVKGTTQGTITNEDGIYSLSNITEGTTLVFSFVGMLANEIIVGNQTTIDITMKALTIGIEEVVAVGYGTQKLANLTGAVESIDIDGIGSRPLTNAGLALQGKVAGAYISQTSGQPGKDDASILIRGVGTFGNSSPLVIIDGMEGRINDVNPRDIKSVSILKDAASSAIYGNRAANGVILITTKRGNSDKMSIEYTGYYGVQQVTTMPKLLTGLEYLEASAEASFNANGSYPTWYTDPNYMNRFRNKVDPYLYPTDYDWIDATFRPANIVDNYVSISGGNKDFQYSTSVGYLDQDGIVKGNSTKKLSFRTNLSTNFFKEKLKINFLASGHEQKTDDLVDGMTTAIYSIYVAPSTERLDIPGVGYLPYGYNFAATEAGGYRRDKTTPINVMMSASFQPLKSLNVSSSYGLYKWDYSNEVFKPKVALVTLNPNGSVRPVTPRTTSLSIFQQNSLTKVFNATANYSVELPKGHGFNILAGFESREYNYKRLDASRDNLSANLSVLDVGDPNTQKNKGGGQDGAWLSWFGRFNYNFKGKYLLESNLRRDGSSRFLEKWGTFPSLSVGWRISEEPFVKNNIAMLSNLKFRASWGRLGNESIGQFYAASDELSLNLSTNFNNTLYPAAAVTKLANRQTSWETSEQINFGLDFGLFENKFSGVIDYFKKSNYDILMQIPVSSTLGITTLPYQNVGKMDNDGIELKLNYIANIKEVKLNSTISVSKTRNQITGLAGQDPIIMGNIIWKEGEAYNSFYALQTEGIYQSQEEINDHLLFTANDGTKINPYMGLTPVPGDIRFQDQLTIDTNKDGIMDTRDGVINNDDKVVLGKPYPDWVFAANIGLEWKAFDFTIFMQGVYGIESLNQGMVTSPFHGGSANTGIWYKDAWRPESPSKTIQRLSSDPSRFEIVSAYYLEDASYLRAKNIEIGYSLPKHIIDRLGISGIRFYASMQNAFTITKMRYGFDPEKPGTTTSTLQYPQTRITSFGVNLKF
jgi:TonB-linked SusC/RagA family outer membrane protein